MTKFKIQNKSKIEMSNSKTKVLSFSICALTLFCHLCFGIWISSAYAQDKIVAIVNNDAITQKDLNDFLNFTTMQLSRQYKGRELEEKIDSIKMDLLNRLIEDRLILQEANRAGISVDEARIKAKVNEVKKRYNSEMDFQAELSKQGFNQADIEKRIREQFLMFSIVEQKVRSQIIVRPDEVTSFYENNKKEFLSGEERALEAFTLDNEDLAGTFSYKLKSGKSPEELAALYTFSVNKLSVHQGEELKKDIEDAVFKLGAGDVSNPVKIDNKYYVFRLIDIKAPRQLTLLEVQDKIHAFLFERKMQEELTKWLDGLKKQSYVKIK